MNARAGRLAKLERAAPSRAEDADRILAGIVERLDGIRERLQGAPLPPLCEMSPAELVAMGAPEGEAWLASWRAERAAP